VTVRTCRPFTENATDWTRPAVTETVYRRETQRRGAARTAPARTACSPRTPWAAGGVVATGAAPGAGGVACGATPLLGGVTAGGTDGGTTLAFLNVQAFFSVLLSSIVALAAPRSIFALSAGSVSPPSVHVMATSFHPLTLSSLTV
jgi:hypothetical protein